MPWKLVPPNPPKTKVYYVRGTYVGIAVDQSTGTDDKAAAARILARWRKQAERGEFSPQRKERRADGDQSQQRSFLAAAVAYMQAGGATQFLNPITTAWRHRALDTIDQIAIDALAVELYPEATAATRNRQVYTPISAVLKHAGIEKRFKRPRGWKGKKATSWLEPAQAFALFAAADDIDREFGLLCRFLLYTGMRLGEGLSRRMRHLHLDRAFVYLPDSKTGEPRGCHLPPHLVAAFRAQPARPVTEVRRDASGHFLTAKPRTDEGVAFLERHADAKLFRFHSGGALRDLLKQAMEKAGLSFPRRQGGFHLFCHTYGSWMHHYAGLSPHGLARTGRWADPDSADRYVHTAASEEARMADMLPPPPLTVIRGDGGEKTRVIERK